MFSFRWTGAALACGIMGFPLLVRPIRLAMEAIDRRLEEAAATLGANRLAVFATVTLAARAARPDRRLRAVLRQGAGRVRRHHHVRVEHPRRDATLSAAIYTFTQVPGGDAAAGRLVLIAIAISLVALILSEWLARRAGMRFHGE